MDARGSELGPGRSSRAPGFAAKHIHGCSMMQLSKLSGKQDEAGFCCDFEDFLSPVLRTGGGFLFTRRQGVGLRVSQVVVETTKIFLNAEFDVQ